jgi:hypothetical protein
MHHGLERAIGIDQQVAAFLSQCNGKRTLGDLLAMLSPKEGVDPEQVRSGCLAVMRQLIRRGFVVAK